MKLINKFKDGLMKTFDTLGMQFPYDFMVKEDQDCTTLVLLDISDDDAEPVGKFRECPDGTLKLDFLYVEPTHETLITTLLDNINPCFKIFADKNHDVMLRVVEILPSHQQRIVITDQPTFALMSDSELVGKIQNTFTLRERDEIMDVIMRKDKFQYISPLDLFKYEERI